jgi:membrane protease YdiL (CAAX protease family)
VTVPAHVAHRVAWGGAACALLVWAPVTGEHRTIPLLAALPAGAGTGIIVFALLAATWRPPPLGRSRVARAVAAATPPLALGAAAEEAIWRYGALGFANRAIGPLGALLASSIGFAFVHFDRTRLRGLAIHGALGVVFGGVYLLTGSLAAAVAAHLTYNLLVVGACAGWTGRDAVDAAT